MENAALRSVRLEFAKRAEWRRDEEERKLDIGKAKVQREKEERRERNLDEAHDALIDMVVAVLATDADLQTFVLEVDAYKPATVEALMDIEDQLQQVGEELQILLDQAYVLPDGRKVFKTEDGTRVFDEHGVEVKDLDPNEIEDWRPYWERYDEPFKRKFALTEERENLLEFQKLTDDVDAEIADARKNGGMTRDRLQELREKLANEAPEAVKKNIRGGQPDLPANIVTPDPDPRSVQPEN
ncbi:hypothetical protein QBK99_25175 [Corticibacterium sp. UT-5YL-CI-8]|nr:hypothetical protein [Tianweitania sp. UT-5YL-CI-8]